MPVYNRIKCPNCQKWNDVRLKKHRKQTFCKCGQFISVTASNSTFCIEYYYQGRRIREKIGTSKTLAENALSKREVEIVENKYFDVKKVKEIKFVDFAEEYLNIHAKRFRSYKAYALTNTVTLNRYFGGKYLHEISVRDIEEFKMKRMKEVSPGTVNRQLSCLKSIFNRAKEWDRFNGPNPVCKVKFLKENNQRTEFLSEPEIKKMVEVSDDYFRPILITAIVTGMRRGEILALKWRDVDFNTNTIYIREAKNGEGRAVSMCDDLKNVLIAVRKNPKSDFIFNTRQGERRFDLRRPFVRVLKKAGITRNIRFHDLRHTFASHLVMKGESLNTVRELLGHKTTNMTLRYSHLSPHHKGRAVSLLNGLTVLSPKPALPTENLTADTPTDFQLNEIVKNV